MQDLTHGSISRHLLKTTGFMLVGMVMQTLYVLIDLYWVGRLGTEAVAAVAVGGNVTFIVLAASQTLGVGTTSLIAQAVGRKDHVHAQETFSQSQLLAFVCAVVFLIVTMASRDMYVNALAADAASAALARDFLGWFLPAMALQFGLVGMGAALRGTGRFKPGMYVHAGTVVLNMALAPMLVFGWGPFDPMGVVGTSIATFVSVAVGTVAMVWYFTAQDAYLRLSAFTVRPDVRRWAAMLKIGVPAGLEFLLMTVYLLVVYAVSRPFGAAAQAGFGIGMRVLQSGFLPVVALGMAVGPVAGQNFGARQFDRVKATFRDAAGIAATWMVMFSILAHFAPHALFAPFTSDPLVIATGVEYLRIASYSFAGSGVIFVSSSIFQAVGNSMPPLIASAARTILVVAIVFGVSTMAGFNLQWVWWISVVSVFLQVAINLLFLRYEFRTRLSPQG
jgi:putative MATE family efflux protein